MAINFFVEEVDFVLSDKLVHRKWIKEVASIEKRFVGNLNFIFSTDQYILNINKTYLGHNYFTDVITFDYCNGDHLIGDIFISLDTVRKNSVEFNCAFQDELDRVIIHGVLHLIGYNDKFEEEKLVMRNKEDAYLGVLRSNFPIN